MTTPGYSATPLVKKLGINPGMKLLLINEPANYFDLLGLNTGNQPSGKNDLPDLVHLFAKNKKDFEKEMIKLRPLYHKKPTLIIWVSWYKKAAKIPTDMTEDTIRDFALKNGLVDVK